jgi:hypothetical protein
MAFLLGGGHENEIRAKKEEKRPLGFEHYFSFGVGHKWKHAERGTWR